jgi:hypothetical protein
LNGKKNYVNKIILHLSLFYLAAVISPSLYCQSNNYSKKNASYGTATKELIEMVDKNPTLKSLLIASIEKARQINPDIATNPSQSLDEYYAFVSKSESSVPWTLVKNEQHLQETFYSFFVDALLTIVIPSAMAFTTALLFSVNA